MDWSLPGSSVHGILQARILEWMAMLSSRRALPDPGMEPASLRPPALAGGFFTTSATGEASLRYIPILIFGTYERYLLWQKLFTDIIKLMRLRWGAYPGVIQVALNAATKVLLKGKQRERDCIQRGPCVWRGETQRLGWRGHKSPNAAATRSQRGWDILP